MDDRRVLTLAEVRRALGGIGKTSVYELIAAGKFPTPLPVTAQGKVWLKTDVQWYLRGLQLGGRLKRPASDNTGSVRTGSPGGETRPKRRADVDIP